MKLDVLAPGVLTTVQDRGRVGWRHLGVALAGALDAEAAALANRLAGNADGAAVLELTLHGPTLRLPRPVRIAICGAAVQAHFEDEAGARTIVGAGRPVDLPAGTLRLGPIRDGLRAWVAFGGGIDVPVVLGSRSTDLRGGFGGLQGRALRRGDELPLANPPALDCTTPRMTRWWVDPVEHDPDAPIRFVPSTHALAMRLEGSHWRISAHGNRQGLRLEGPALPATGGDVISAAVAPGTLQLPPDGQPIVLLADAQTVGGYPRLGHVVAADLPRLAQFRPGAGLRLQAIDAPDAAALLRARRVLYARLHHAVADRRG